MDQLSTRTLRGVDSLRLRHPAWKHNKKQMLDWHEINLCQVITWHFDTSKRPYLTCSVRVQDLVFDDKPQSLPLLLIGLWPLQIAAHWRVCVRWHLRHVKYLMSHKVLYQCTTVHLKQNKASFTSLSAAGIFLCFLEKAKVALFPGDTPADRACLPDEMKQMWKV